MKRLFLFLFITGFTFAQNWYNDISGQGFWFNDSLYNADTTLAIPLSFNYEWIYFAIQDTGTTYDDSVIVEQGIIKFTGNYLVPTYSDTTWHQIPVRDSTWTLVNILVDDNSVHAYTVYTPLMDLIRIRRTNVEAVATRATYIWGVGKRK